MRKFIVGLLSFLVLVFVAVILFILYSPERAKDMGRKASEHVANVRKPPPRPTIIPTETPMATPASPRIPRELKVSEASYPFRVKQRVNQPDGKMRVTIEIKNNSIREWPVAYLTLSSAFHPAREVYRFDSWKIGETRTVDYVFPASEFRERLGELRVEDVSGRPPSAAMLERMGVAAAAPGKETHSPGLLRMWSRGKSSLRIAGPSADEMLLALAGGEAEKVREMTQNVGVSIDLSGLGVLDTVALNPNEVQGPERQARELYNEAMAAADETIQALRELGDLLSARPYGEAMAPGGPGMTLLERIRENDQELFERILAVQSIHQRKATPETERLTRRLQEASDLVKNYKDTLERQARAAYPKFTLGE